MKITVLSGTITVDVALTLVPIVLGVGGGRNGTDP